ncbi:unnamed protein product [Symbiodinium natans]|uniref:Uncharacterized protein n=1 Tax=Symbiodinium natans TaxID=878477 RepID=A0A812TPH4_9DINO|nr:unnamed protein product [Symbiodinium natans]
MVLHSLFGFLFLASAGGEDLSAALADDACVAGQACSLEFRQLRGMKVSHMEAMEALDDREEQEVNATAAQGAVRSSWQHAGCCNGCHTAFCSPESGSCYDYKGKYYYLECANSAPTQGSQGHSDCCGSCSSYCSPQSGRCYDFKGKDYYLECMAPSGPSGNFGTNVGDWERLAGKACMESSQSKLIYGLPSRTACKEKCMGSEYPWCRTFQFSSSSACSSLSMCTLLNGCSNVEADSCWDYYFID